MPIVVRPVELRDLEPVADLLIEMDKFYDEPERESAETKVANMKKFLFGEPPSAYLLVAHEEGDAAMFGIAAYSFLWPAIGTSRSLHLKELYVRQAHRRDGIGRLLMDSISEAARSSRCSRVEWTTDRGNTNAQEFYSSFGVDADDRKLFYRLRNSSLETIRTDMPALPS